MDAVRVLGLVMVALALGGWLFGAPCPQDAKGARVILLGAHEP